MQYKCQECNDTGSRDKLGTYLDCNACDAATMRRDLNDFVKSLGHTHPEDVALAIHQRALAMAPKQEALKPTDISQRLREVVIPGVHKKYRYDLLLAAWGIEKYYGEMINWREVAEAKEAFPVRNMLDSWKMAKWAYSNMLELKIFTNGKLRRCGSDQDWEALTNFYIAISMIEQYSGKSVTVQEKEIPIPVQPVAVPCAMEVPEPDYSSPVLENEAEIAHAEGWNACRNAMLKVAPAAANGAPEGQPLIGKLMDKLCFLPVLWGLNEPGALLRHSDVFRMLVDANREQAAVLAAAGPDAALPDFCFEDDADFMHRLGLLMNTKWPEMCKDGLARKISELANAHIRAALSGAKGN